jgi:hypothetical protein
MASAELLELAEHATLLSAEIKTSITNATLANTVFTR